MGDSNKQKVKSVLDQSYKIGIPGIDEQHNEIIFFCNEFLEHQEKGKTPPDFLETSLQQLSECLKAHSSTEMSLMEMIEFPGIDEHKEQNKKVYKHFSGALKAQKKGDNDEMNQCISAFRDAVLEHIAVWDTEYTAHIENLIVLKKKYNISANKAVVLTR